MYARTHVLICAIVACTACGGSTDPSTLQLVGQWGTTEIEGAINADGTPRTVDASTSTWTFNDAGTYQWFLHAPPFFDVDGGGTYRHVADTIFVTGIVQTALSTPQAFVIMTDVTESRFRFRDNEGDRWTYERR